MDSDRTQKNKMEEASEKNGENESKTKAVFFILNVCPLTFLTIISSEGNKKANERV